MNKQEKYNYILMELYKKNYCLELVFCFPRSTLDSSLLFLEQVCNPFCVGKQSCVAQDSEQLAECTVLFFFHFKCLVSFFASSPTKLHENISVDNYCKFVCHCFNFYKMSFFKNICESDLPHTIFTLMQQNYTVTKCFSAFSALKSELHVFLLSSVAKMQNALRFNIEI